ncbi:hypothetical protein BJ875DRAFT_492604 [Amylocarpus encephaloides]|uniref:Glycoprotease family protein n=1 Tax=Amylocarpus encephaloides TaxID=45428 RepID=A0A9P7YRY6_9HELO|nr:hypothetical protein BJ875DRAFT_492604 [Amylocarpus encephaloides]
MSAVPGTAGKSSTSNGVSIPAANSPFTDFEEDDSDDAYEWWDEDDRTLPKSTKPTKTTPIPRLPKTPVTLVTISDHTSLNRHVSQKTNKRVSVHKPLRSKSRWRQKKQQAQAGIQLVTDFSARQKAAPTQAQAQPNAINPHVGKFIDLAALQSLDGEPAKAKGGFWSSKKNKAIVEAATPATEAVPKRTHLIPSIQDHPTDLSPMDRPIFIGLTIPTSDVSVYSTSPQTASSETANIVRSYEERTPTLLVPETPTIVITPALEATAWSPTGDNGINNGHFSSTSSFYSQASADQVQNSPPVPKLPNSIVLEDQRRLAAQKPCFSPDSDNGTVWEDESAYTSRVVSSCTVFEEDVSPIIARTARGHSVTGRARAGTHASISTIGTNRHSRGWWNYITTPFLTRSNTFVSRDLSGQQPPALPSLAIAAAQAHAAERNTKTWEKQFSPLTPATSTTIQSDAWWNREDVDSKSVVASPIDGKTGHKIEKSTATVPLFFLLDNDSPEPTYQNPRAENHEQQENVATSPISQPMMTPVMNDNRSLPDSPFQISTGQLQSNNPFIQPQAAQAAPTNEPLTRGLSNRRQVDSPSPVTVVQPPAPVIINSHHSQSPMTTPPPAYSPPPARVPRYRAIFPPGHDLNTQQPMSPGPITPGIQNAMAAPGAMQMSEVPLTPAGTRRQINLNSSYPELPPRDNGVQHIMAGDLQGTSSKAKKAEAKRRRHEKEDAIAHKASGWWRGRGCIPKRGCYGRKGAEGRKKRRCYLALIIGFLLVIVLAVVLATTLHRKSSPVIQPSQWLNLTGFPPIFAGLSTIAAPEIIVSNTGCIIPSTLWSCSLPKELQPSVAPNNPNQPNFLLNIEWDSDPETNATFANVTGNPNLPIRSVGGNAVSAGHYVRSLLRNVKRAISIRPNPEPPSFAEELFLGNTTDAIVSPNKAGEPTPFYISFLQPPKSNFTKRTLLQRQKADNDSGIGDPRDIIPKPDLNTDGTAKAANLFPLPEQQPVRLYDRGLPTEHYGFYSYFDRSIFLKSLDQLSVTNPTDDPDDTNGGATEEQAKFRCTWTQTRYLVQMWTRMNTTARLLNATHVSTNASTDLQQPGSFPYPSTITIDRHGGNDKTKMIFCYALDNRGGLNPASAKFRQEDRGFGGIAINPAPFAFGNSSDPNLGGFDGGSAGCSCRWNNFRAIA